MISDCPAMTMANNRLMQEIGDEFLTCKICFEPFTEPKSLSCLHTFCEKCLDGHVNSQRSYKYGDHCELTCPLCRKKTSVPTGGVRKLPDNFLVLSLHDLIGRQRPSKLPFCEICKLVHKKMSEACSKCVDCSKLLCRSCVEMHNRTKVTQGHAVYDIESEKEIVCKEHEEEMIRFFCERCDACVCVLCTFTDHKDHEVTNFKDGVCKYRPSIEDQVVKARDRIKKLKDQLEKVGECESTIKQCEREICDVAAQFCHVIRAKERNLLEELHELVGSDTMEFIANKTAMRETLESLQSTCSLAELVLGGREIEFLLVKKQLQEKLSNFGDGDNATLPEAVGKKVTFIQGSVTLGYLEVESPKVDNGKHVRFLLPESERQEGAERGEKKEGKRVGGEESSDESEETAESGEEFHDATSDEEYDEELEGMMGPLLEYKSVQTDVVEMATVSTMTDAASMPQDEGQSSSDSSDKEVQTELSLCMRRRSRPGDGGQGGGGGVQNGVTITNQPTEGSAITQQQAEGDTKAEEQQQVVRGQLNRQETM